MTSTDFLDFNDYYAISRNNKYTFLSNKLETTIDYFLHMNKCICKSKAFEVRSNIAQIFAQHDLEHLTNCNIYYIDSDTNYHSYTSDKSDTTSENYDSIKLTINDYENDYLFEENIENTEKLVTPKFKPFITKTDPEICAPTFVMFNNLYSDQDYTQDLEYDNVYNEEILDNQDLYRNENSAEESDSEELFY